MESGGQGEEGGRMEESQALVPPTLLPPHLPGGVRAKSSWLGVGKEKEAKVEDRGAVGPLPGEHRERAALRKRPQTRALRQRTAPPVSRGPRCPAPPAALGLSSPLL